MIISNMIIEKLGILCQLTWICAASPSNNIWDSTGSRSLEIVCGFAQPAIKVKKILKHEEIPMNHTNQAFL